MHCIKAPTLHAHAGLQADSAQVAGLKDEGNKLFGRKEYTKAFEAYEKALKMLPEGHSEAVLLHSNKAACSMMLKK
jgi:tetratricopeptide (TPR) repeat protein